MSTLEVPQTTCCGYPLSENYDLILSLIKQYMAHVAKQNSDNLLKFKLIDNSAKYATGVIFDAMGIDKYCCRGKAECVFTIRDVVTFGGN